MVIERKRGPSLERDLYVVPSPVRRSQPTHSRSAHPPMSRHSHQRMSTATTYRPPAKRDRSPLPPPRRSAYRDDREVAYGSRPRSTVHVSNGSQSQTRFTSRDDDPPVERTVPQSRLFNDHYERRQSPSPDLWEVEYSSTPAASRSQLSQRDSNPVMRNPTRLVFSHVLVTDSFALFSMLFISLF